LGKISALRDLQYDEPLDYPSINVKVDRERAGQLGVNGRSVGRSFLAATSSAALSCRTIGRILAPGVAYQVQVQIPQSEMTSIQDVEHIPVTLGASSHPCLAMSLKWLTEM